MRSERTTVVVMVVVVALFIGMFASIGRSVFGDASAPVAAVAFDPATVKPALVPTPGFPQRIFPAVAWTGDRLFVYGGYRPGNGDVVLLNDAVLLEPGTGATERLPMPPFGPLFEPRAARVGSEVVVVGPSCTAVVQPEEGEAAGCRPGTYVTGVFDLRTREWRVVAVPPALKKFGPFTSGEYRVTRALGVTSDRRVIFELARPLFRPPYDVEYWSFSPSNDEWVSLGSPGIRPEGSCLAGDRLVVFTARFLNKGSVLDDHPGRLSGSYGGNTDDGWVEPSLSILDLNTASTWAQSEAVRGVNFGTSEPKLVCAGASVLLLEARDRTKLRRYELDMGVWSIPALPPPGVTTFRDSERVWTGTESVLLSGKGPIAGDSVAYDPATNAWRAVTGVPTGLTNATWSGSAIVGYSEPLDGAKAGIYWYPVG